MKSFLITILSICILYSSSSSLNAKTDEESSQKDRIYVVQEKIFHRYHEAGFLISYIPDDDFYDSFGLGANYVYHFNDFLSWEVFRAEWMFNQEKSLKNNIEKSLEITPTFYDELTYMVHSQLWFRPFYGKSAVMNQKIIFHETGLFAGLGMIGYDRNKSFGNNANDTSLSVCFGAGTTFFLNSFSGINFQIRNMMHFKDNQTENRISLEIGYSFRFNLTPREKIIDNPKIDRFNRYINSNVLNY